MTLSNIGKMLTLGTLIGGILLVLAGCETAGTGASGSATIPAAGPAVTQKTVAEKGGAELWAETCSRCHNLRSPSSYGPNQWEVAVYDMRVRANLTGQEQRKILEFLKAASQ